MKNEQSIYEKTKDWICKCKLKCDKCEAEGKIGEGFVLLENNPANIAVYFECLNCKKKYFSSMPGHFESAKFQALSSPSLFTLRFLNKIFKQKN